MKIRPNITPLYLLHIFILAVLAEWLLNFFGVPMEITFETTLLTGLVFLIADVATHTLMYSLFKWND